MEVHHHPNVHQKKFKEYILEFFMIFLAVTMGFFAESLREHITEKKKEKEYIRGFVNDLATDTSKLTHVIKYYDHIIPQLDSGRKNFYRLQSAGALHTVGVMQISIAGFKDFIYTDITLQQIKSAGGFLLIKHKASVDSILSHDAKVRAALINEKVLGDLMISLQHEMGGLVNLQPLLETVGRNNNPLEQHRLADSLNKLPAGFLLTHDPVISGQFYYDYTYYETIASLVKAEMIAVKHKAGSTIEFLKKAYNLGDEL